MDIPEALYYIFDEVENEFVEPVDNITRVRDLINYSGDDRNPVELLRDHLTPDVINHIDSKGRSITHFIAALVPEMIPSLAASDLGLINWNLADIHQLLPAHYAASVVGMNEEDLIESLYHSPLDFFTTSVEYGLTADDILQLRREAESESRYKNRRY